MRSASVITLALFLVVGRAQGQVARELQLHGVGVVTASDFVGGGVGVALRAAGRTRVGLSASVGHLAGQFGGRGAAVITYHLAPFRRRGVAPYIGGGISVVVASTSQEYLVVLLGVESTPGLARGWFVEAGVSGGLLLSAGVRFRWRGRPAAPGR